MRNGALRNRAHRSIGHNILSTLIGFRVRRDDEPKECQECQECQRSRWGRVWHGCAGCVERDVGSRPGGGPARGARPGRDPATSPRTTREGGSRDRGAIHASWQCLRNGDWEVNRVLTSGHTGCTFTYTPNTDGSNPRNARWSRRRWIKRASVRFVGVLLCDGGGATSFGGWRADVLRGVKKHDG